MPLRSYKPTSAGRRFMTRSTFEEITTDEPHKPLLEAQKRGSGRNNQGRLTVRHRGGGEKRHYRRIDFKRDKFGVPGPARDDRVRPEPLGADRPAALSRRREALHAGPERTARWATSWSAAPGVEARVGNALPLADIPLGTTIHNIELVPGKGGQIVRSAGAVGPAARQGGRLRRRCDSPRARCGACSTRCIGHRRPGGQPGPREPEHRQGRTRPPHGPAARGARRGDEPARPSARRRRGQVARPACRRRHRGASRRWATARAATRSRGASSCAPAIARARPKGGR